MKDGDNTIQSAQLNKPDPNQGEKIAIMRAIIQKIEEIVNTLNSYMDVDEKSLSKTLVHVPGIMRDYIQLSLFGLVTAREANKEISILEKALYLLEDK